MGRFDRFSRTRGQRPVTSTLSLFDSPIGTTTNNLVCAAGLVSGTAAGILILLTFLPGAPKLPVGTFAPCFALAFPLVLWAVIVMNTLVGWERMRKGLPRRLSRRIAFASSPFADLPEGFLRVRDKVAMGLGLAIGFFAASSAPMNSAAPPNRGFLGVSFAFTTIATVIALAEHRRRSSLHLQGVLGWPQPPVSAPRLARSRSLIVWLLVTGAGLAAVGGTVSVLRSNDYQYREARLVSDGTTTVTLPGGDDVIFVGNLLESAMPPFDPAQVIVVAIGTRTRVPTRWDPSSDHNSPDGIASLGLISFTAPRNGRYRITVTGPRGLTLFVARNPGAEARLLAGWIALLIVGLGILVFGIVCFMIRVSWRYRVVRLPGGGKPRTVEEWMSQGDAR